VACYSPVVTAGFDAVNWSFRPRVLKGKLPLKR